MSRCRTSRRWAPCEPGIWSLCAYGRTVMHESKGGALTTTLGAGDGLEQLYIQAEVKGRMLVEAYCNGEQLLDVLVSNEELDCFIDLSHRDGGQELKVELVFIPATFGEVRIAREVSFVDSNARRSVVEAISAS